MHANNNYQIQEIFFRKEKKMMIYASFVGVLDLSENFQKVIYFGTEGISFNEMLVYNN